MLLLQRKYEEQRSMVQQLQREKEEVAKRWKRQAQRWEEEAKRAEEVCTRVRAEVKRLQQQVASAVQRATAAEEKHQELVGGAVPSFDFPFTCSPHAIAGSTDVGVGGGTG